MKRIDAHEAVSLIEPGNQVYIHEASMAPLALIEALGTYRSQLRDVSVIHLHTNAPAPYVEPGCEGHVRHNALFVGPNVRDAVGDGRADFTPVFLSEVPGLIRDRTIPVDVAFVQVSPPDRHGFCRLGLSVACARSAVDSAPVVVAEINEQVPRTLGNSSVHVNQIDYFLEVDRELPSSEPSEVTEVGRAIGRHVAALVPNAATIQMGIGGIPDAVLAELKGHEGLGVHTEMFSEGLIDLIASGVVTGHRKSRFERRVVTSFAMGRRRLFDFVDNNPLVEFHSTSVVNNLHEIAKQHFMTSINSAIEIDITGQVCADSIGERIHSGIGGQMDFVQGALRSPGGKAIIALPSTARKGTESRIVSRLRPGAGVVTTRGHVHWVVTEFGAANLRGRTLRERAELLISIAHPDHRAELRAAAQSRKLA